MLTKKKYLPSIPFEDRINDIIEEFFILIKEYYSPPFLERRSKIYVDFLRDIYQDKEKDGWRVKYYPFRTLSYYLQEQKQE